MFFRWLDTVRREFRTLLTGSLVLLAMGLAQGVWQVPIPRLCYLAVIGSFLTWAFYRTWQKERSAFEAVTSAKTTEVEALGNRKDDEIAALRVQKDNEIAALNERITELSRRPYSEEKRRIAEQVLDNVMTLEGRRLLHHLMINEHVEVGRAFLPEIPDVRRAEQLGLAKQHGIVQHWENPPRSRITYWIINPQFRPVLEDVLYEGGRL